MAGMRSFVSLADAAIDSGSPELQDEQQIATSRDPWRDDFGWDRVISTKNSLDATMEALKANRLNEASNAAAEATRLWTDLAA